MSVGGEAGMGKTRLVNELTNSANRLRCPFMTGACSEAELKAFCVEHLGTYKTPKVIRFVEELPRGPSGKVQRLKLVELSI